MFSLEGFRSGKSARSSPFFQGFDGRVHGRVERDLVLLNEAEQHRRLEGTLDMDMVLALRVIEIVKMLSKREDTDAAIQAKVAHSRLTLGKARRNSTACGGQTVVVGASASGRGDSDLRSILGLASSRGHDGQFRQGEAVGGKSYASKV